MRFLAILCIFLMPSLVSGADYECEVKTFDGKETSVVLISKETYYLFMSESDRFRMDIISAENNDYLHLFVVSDEISFHVGLNKKLNFMIMDGMDLKNDRPSSRVTGNCSKL